MSDEAKTATASEAPLTLRKIVRLFRATGVRARHIVLPVVFSLLTATLSGVALGLLVPLAKGLMSGDFAYAAELPVLGSLLRAWGDPESPLFVLLFLAGAIVAITLLNFVLKYVLALYTRYWSGIFARNVSELMFVRLLSFGRRYFDESSRGSIAQLLRFSESVLAVLQKLREAVSSAFQLLGRTVVMLLISWPVALVVLALLPLLQVAMIWQQRRLRRQSQERRTARLALAREVHSLLSAVDLVQGSSFEQVARERYRIARERLRGQQFAVARLQELFHPVQDVMAVVVLLGILVFAAVTTEPGEGRVAEYVVLFYVARSAMPHLADVLRTRFDLTPLLPELEAIVHVLEESEEYVVAGGDREFTGFRDRIALNDLHFSYHDGTAVLHGFSCEIPKGSTTAFVGVTGAGKSTIARLLLRFYDVRPGEITVDGVDIREFTVESWRRALAYVGQEVILLNETVRANLTFGLARDVTEEELESVLERVRLLDAVRAHPDGLDAELGDNGVRLSGGERQRLAIARALLRRAEILILDEATSALDAETELVVQRELERASTGRTVIVIAQRLTTIQAADNVVVIDGGRVVENGSFDELVARQGVFASMWRTFRRDQRAQQAGA